MREVMPQIEAWLASGQRVAVATVVKVWGSAPRPLGSKMAISSSGEMVGSVSGGCVEGAIFEEAQSVLADGRAKLVGYGISNDQAWAIGLSCGGRIEVFIEALPRSERGEVGEIFAGLRRSLAEEKLVAVATIVAGPGLGRQLLLRPAVEPVGSLGGSKLDQQAVARATLAVGCLAAQRFSVDLEGESIDVFLEVHAPRAQLVIIGAVHVAVALVDYARVLGLRTVVIDPRTAFATAERFAGADRLITEWPQEALAEVSLNESTSVALLSHDLKLDLPALQIVLRRPVRYIGALGSKKTHAKRVAALREGGFSEAEIGRIHNPIGLNLGGRRAEEIALSVLAEVVAVSHGLDYRPLAEG